MAKSRGRKFAEITSPTSGVFDLTSVPTITNAKLQNSAMTLAGSSVSLGGTGVADTDALSEGSSNLYFTNTRVQSFLGGGTLAGNIVVPDNRSIYLGSDSDFRLVHNTTNTQLINATGALQVTSNGGFDVTGAATFSSTIAATGAITANAGVVVDNITIDGTEIDLSSGDLTLDVAGDIILDADGGQSRFRDGGTEFFVVSNESAVVQLYSTVSDSDIHLVGNDGGSAITALALDMSAAGEATFNAGIKLGDGYAAQFGASQDLLVYHSSNENIVQANTSDQDLLFKGKDGSSTITALTLDMSEGGAATFNAGATFNGSVSVTGSGNTALAINTGNNSGDNSQIKFGDSADDDVGQINYDHQNNKFQFRTNGGANALELESNGNPVFKGTNHTNLQVKSGDDSVVAFIQTVQGTDARFGTSTNHPVNFAQNGAFRLTLDTNGNTAITGLLGVNKAVNSAVGLSVGADSTATNSYGLEVTNASANTRFLVNGLGDSFFYKTDNAVGVKFDSTSGRLGIGPFSGTPNSPLHVLGDLGTSVSAVVRIRGTNATARTTRLQFEDYNGTIADGLIDFVIPNAGSTTGAYLGMGFNQSAQIKMLHTGAIEFGGNVLATDIIAKDSGGLSFQTDEGSKRLTIQDNGTLRFFTGVSYSDMYMYAQSNVLGNGQITMQPVTTPGSGTADQYLHLASTAASGARTRMNLRVDGFLQCGYNVDSAYALQVSNGTYVWLIGTSGNTLNFYGASGTRYGHVSTSNGGTFVNGSDRALKENIVDLEYGLKEVKEIQSRRYDIKETGDTAVGFIAQELKEVIPEVVEGEEGSMGVAYANLVPVLVKAIQELSAEVEVLKAKLEE